MPVPTLIDFGADCPSLDTATAFLTADHQPTKAGVFAVATDYLGDPDTFPAEWHDLTWAREIDNLTRYELGLDTDQGESNYERNQSTGFPCRQSLTMPEWGFPELSFGNDPRVTYIVMIFKWGDLRDCIAVGHDPQGVIDGNYATVPFRLDPKRATTCKVL
jgi:hypothetical protein